MLRHVLLALMRDGRAVHGYALMKAFAARSGVRVSIGNVYRELQQLRTNGLIAAAANPAGADQRRCPYVITEPGRAALQRWLIAPAESLLREPVDPLLYRLALLDESGTDHAAEFLDELHAQLCSQRKSLERQRAALLLPEKESSVTDRMLPPLLARRAKRLAADIELIEEARSLLTTLQGKLPVKSPHLPPAPRRTRQTPVGRGAEA